ncbi:hypothetical protein LQ51_12945, partial [Micromonospora sp. HK10]
RRHRATPARLPRDRRHRTTPAGLPARLRGDRRHGTAAARLTADRRHRATPVGLAAGGRDRATAAGGRRQPAVRARGPGSGRGQGRLLTGRRLATSGWLGGTRARLGSARPEGLHGAAPGRTRVRPTGAGRRHGRRGVGRSTPDRRSGRARPAGSRRRHRTGMAGSRRRHRTGTAGGRRDRTGTGRGRRFGRGRYRPAGGRWHRAARRRRGQVPVRAELGPLLLRGPQVVDPAELLADGSLVGLRVGLAPPPPAALGTRVAPLLRAVFRPLRTTRHHC